MNASKHKDFKCHNCDMVFPSYALLQKHKASYCIGRAKNPMFERSSSSRSGFSSSSYMLSDPEDYKQRYNPNLTDRTFVNDSFSHEGSFSSRTNLSQPPVNGELQSHQSNITSLRAQNEVLQRQVNEINNRLSQIAYRPGIQSTPTMDMLSAQQARNTNLLRTLQNDVRLEPAGRSYYPANGTLLDELRALKQSYISNGGYDSSILAQIAEMEMAVSELDRLNYSMHSIRENRDKFESLNELLVEFEEENHLLESELLTLQESNNGHLVLTARDDRLTIEEQMQQRQYMFRMSELERQMELVQQQLKLEKLMQGLKPTYTNVRWPFLL